MPSASTTSPFAASAAIESSLCERTMPGSVQVAISSVCVRSMLSQFYVDAAGRRETRGHADRKRSAQRAAEFLAGLEALLRILGERALEETRQRRRHAGRNAAD